MALGLLVLPGVRAEDDLRKQVEALQQKLASYDGLKAEVEALRREKSAAKPVAPSATASAVVDNKYGPNAAVVTKAGKLTIGGLVQVWYYSIQNDNLGFFGDLTVPARLGGDTNETKDNDSFRVRRTQLKFKLDINENITGYIMIDPAREAQSFPSLNTNLGIALRGRTNETSSAVTNVQSGTAGSGRFLQDAWINYHGVVPHHDFQVGQFKPFLGEEGIRSATELDFVERSLVGQSTQNRDLGLTAHGTWWDDRFQYWLGVHNSPGNLHGSAGQFQNRSDDNDQKDVAIRVLLRPVWKHFTWGSLELGYSTQFGKHGEAGNPDDRGTPSVDGLDRERTWAYRHGAWVSYKPNGPVSGWWLRGEWTLIHDRNVQGQVRGFPQTSAANVQGSPRAFDVSGWYFATGYKLSESVFAGGLPKLLKPVEFAYRYESYQNVTVGDLVRPEVRTDVFSSTIHTAGINYYLKGHNAKIQANYNWVNEPDENNNFARRRFREVRNDNFVVNFQVAW